MYIEKAHKYLDKLNIKSVDQKDVKILSAFFIHTKFLSDNYKTFQEYYFKVIDKDILNELSTRKNELDITLNKNLYFLNLLTAFIFLLFLISFMVIIYLLLKSSRENLRLILMKEHIDYSYYHDSLTLLRNRVSFEQDEHNFSNPSIILININAFKELNDLYGTNIGNKVLIDTAKIIQEHSVSKFKTNYFRLGSDEFAIVLEDSHEGSVKSIAKIIESTISLHPFYYESIEIFITVRVSINSTTPLLENADMALDIAKNLKSVGIIVFDQSMDKKEIIKNNLDTLKIVKDAIKNKQVKPYFQPIQDIETGTIYKYEALMRIVQEDKVLAPYQFLDIAYKSSMYEELTKIMVLAVMQEIENYDVRCSINLSMKDITNSSFVEMIEGAFRMRPDIASRIDIELLETAHIYDYNLVNHFIKRLKTFGCKILIDDFGSGYSNFTYLGELDIDIIKIDGSIISKITQDKKHLSTLIAMIAFANANNFDTVAEFVEDEKTYSLLKELGITYAQGYYISKPKPNIKGKN